MPIYDYRCDNCRSFFEVVKSMHDASNPETCPKCQKLATRDYSLCNFYFTGTKVKDAYKCPALGRVIKSDYDRSEQAKRLGCVEIGNDFETGEKLQSSHDAERERKRNKIWEDL